jgi:hypothetical protein
MGPPLKSDDAQQARRADSEAPLSRWKIIGSYETAAECAAAKDREFGRAWGEYQEVAKLKSESAPGSYLAIFRAAMTDLALEGVNVAGAASCISVQDPRLKP